MANVSPTQSTKFTMTRDINGYNGFGIPFVHDGFYTTLAASTAQSITIPSNYPNWIAIFSYTPGASIWVANNTAATLPGVAFSSTVSELNPTARQVAAGDVLSFITGDATIPSVSVLLLVIPTYGN